MESSLQSCTLRLTVVSTSFVVVEQITGNDMTLNDAQRILNIKTTELHIFDSQNLVLPARKWNETMNYMSERRNINRSGVCLAGECTVFRDLLHHLLLKSRNPWVCSIFNLTFSLKVESYFQRNEMPWFPYLTPHNYQVGGNIKSFWTVRLSVLSNLFTSRFHRGYHIISQIVTRLEFYRRLKTVPSLTLRPSEACFEKSISRYDF